MNWPNRKWTIHAIHHAHTDVGYTDRQEKIELYHIAFIQQAIAISEAIRAGDKPEWEGFRWTCESFWPVECFLKASDDSWRERLAQAVLAGHIELTANYLHIVEIMDAELFGEFAGRAVAYGKEIGKPLTSAMTADLNGYGWGYAQTLYDQGIRQLSMNVHTHHGMYPAWRKQMPFWWELPSGDRLLVWNGDHYCLGNELGIAPDAHFSYLIRDEYQTPQLTDRQWEIAEARILRYLHNLETEGYPYDFVPVMLSGLLTDNAPPSAAIAAFIGQWNEKHGEQVFIRMSALEEFFAELRTQTSDIPVYRGAWPDWWNDGAFSTPMHTQLFRDAQRTLRMLKQLDPSGAATRKDLVDEAKQSIMMFAEHTWGHSASVSEPWNFLIHATATRKEAFAARAHENASRALDQYLLHSGEALLAYGREMKYKVFNPADARVTEIAQLYVDYWEVSLLERGFAVRDGQTGETYPHQLLHASRGTLVCVELELEPLQTRTLLVEPLTSEAGEGPGEGRTTVNYQLGGLDGVADLCEHEAIHMAADPVRVTESGLETPFVSIAWTYPEGIVSWIDRLTGRELIDSAALHGAFTPVYECTPAPTRGDKMAVRTRMGRNRKGANVKRDSGRLTGVGKIEKGALFCTVELLYEVAGASPYSVLLTVYRGQPKVQASVRMHKDSTWEPENMYVALPFRTAPDAGQLWLDMPGVPVRPYKDQLPGSNVDFYAVDEGYAWAEADYGLAVALPDTPLLQLGPLAYGDRMLNGHPGLFASPGAIYAWVMTNYWETNFKATLGGFYEFTYIVEWGAHLAEPFSALQRLHAMTQKVIAVRAQ